MMINKIEMFWRFQAVCKDTFGRLEPVSVLLQANSYWLSRVCPNHVYKYR